MISTLKATGSLIFDCINDQDFEALNNTVRWDGKPKITEETIAHHSYWVSFFANMLAEKIFEPKEGEAEYIQREKLNFKLNILRFALLHDFDEAFTGDIRFPVKYNEFNGGVIKKAIDVLAVHKTKEKFSNLACSFDNMMKEVIIDSDTICKVVVKVCDWISCLLYVNKEYRMGNLYFRQEMPLVLVELRESVQTCLSTLKTYISKDESYYINTKVLEEVLEIKINPYTLENER